MHTSILCDLLPNSSNYVPCTAYQLSQPYGAKGYHGSGKVMGHAQLQAPHLAPKQLTIDYQLMQQLHTLLHDRSIREQLSYAF